MRGKEERKHSRPLDPVPPVTVRVSGPGKAASALGMTVILLSAIALCVWLLSLVLVDLGAETLSIIAAVLLVLALPALVGSALAGWYFGKVEVRGFLSGVDRTVDALGTAVVHGAKGVSSVKSVQSAQTPILGPLRLLPPLGDAEDVILD